MIEGALQTKLRVQRSSRNRQQSFRKRKYMCEVFMKSVSRKQIGRNSSYKVLSSKLTMVTTRSFRENSTCKTMKNWRHSRMLKSLYYQPRQSSVKSQIPSVFACLLGFTGASKLHHILAEDALTAFWELAGLKNDGNQINESIKTLSQICFNLTVYRFMHGLLTERHQ